jgi:glucose-1-phosphate thymidylyltransferase
VGYLGDQIEDYITENYPQVNAHYVIQENPRGQSHAISLAREYLGGPMLMVFADTLIETDLSFLKGERAEAVVWVKPVPDPRRFGVAQVGDDGLVVRLVEKPQSMDVNLAVVGFYYFQRSEDLLSAIDEQMERDLQLKGEFFLADAVNIMLERGLRMRPEKVDMWLDAGTPEALLETNRYLLDNGRSNSAETSIPEGVVVIPPVFIHPTAQLTHAIIGPHVSLGAGCNVTNSILRNSILEDGACVDGAILDSSLVGRQAQISRRAATINAGDHTTVTL